ncbi:hypothetical protein NGH41_13090, partial [Staphylococcus succinus]|uniref:hypothetical protein n=1 Tax=Staphylococcus succinus TaxID=61015 RepID=UPI002DBABDA8
GFPMGSTINNISYKDIVAKSLQFQKNSFSNGLIKNNYTGLGFPMGSTINNISYKDIVAKSLQFQKNSFS